MQLMEGRSINYTAIAFILLVLLFLTLFSNIDIHLKFIVEIILDLFSQLFPSGCRLGL